MSLTSFGSPRLSSATEGTENIKIKEFYNQIVQQLPGAFYTCDALGYITYYNDEAVALWGQEPEIGKDQWCGSWKIFWPDGSPCPIESCPMAIALKEGRIVEGVEIIVERPNDGQRRYILPHPRLFWDDAGKIAGAFNILVDITKTKKAESELQISKQRLEKINLELQKNNDQLKKVNTDLDNFIYTASHDLKAPISNIEGLLSSLQESLQTDRIDSKDVNKLMQFIDISITKFRNTIQDLTDISKIQKQSEEDIKEINCAEVIEDVKFTIQDKISESKAEIKVNIPKSFKLKFSRKNFYSIVYNLLSNAIKYRNPSKSPQINVSLYKEGDFTILSVTDNGLGISKGNITKLFTMFKRFHDHVEGTGIGLYIVKRIVDNAHGKIEVDSEENKGSSFKIFFRTT